MKPSEGLPISTVDWNIVTVSHFFGEGQQKSFPFPHTIFSYHGVALVNRVKEMSKLTFGGEATTNPVPSAPTDSSHYRSQARETGDRGAEEPQRYIFWRNRSRDRGKNHLPLRVQALPAREAMTCVHAINAKANDIMKSRQILGNISEYVGE